MAISVKDIGDMFGKDVFTTKGYYAGKVSDVEFDLSRFKMRSVVIEAAKGGVLGQMVGGKKGIIIPFQMVQSIGDVMLIKHITNMPDAETSPDLEME